MTGGSMWKLAFRPHLTSSSANFLDARRPPDRLKERGQREPAVFGPRYSVAALAVAAGRRLIAETPYEPRLACQ